MVKRLFDFLGKTVKYNVENKKSTHDNSNKNNNNANLNGNNKKVSHINELYQPTKSSLNNNNNNNNYSNLQNKNVKIDTSPTVIKNFNTNYYNGGNNNIQIKNHFDLRINSTNNKYNDAVIRNDDDLQRLSVIHEKLINNILGEEEDFINGHRNHIDDIVELVKQEMLLINEVDKPGSDIDSYVSSLDKILQEKADKIQNIRANLFKFHKMLKEEEILAKKFTDYQNEFNP